MKSILRGILPNPAGESEGVFGFIKKAVSSVIPDGVYEFAGLDPKTGETIPEPESEQIAEATGSSPNAYERKKARLDRKRERMEARMNETEEEKAARRAESPPVIINQTDASQVSTNTSSSAVPAPIKDTAAPAGTVPGHPMFGYG